jgi:hypothetical protein
VVRRAGRDVRLDNVPHGGRRGSVRTTRRIDPTIITSLDGDQNFGAPVALTEDDALRLTRTMPDLPESFAWNMKPFIPRW